jgi:hypothetical protein
LDSWLGSDDEEGTQLLFDPQEFMNDEALRILI